MAIVRHRISPMGASSDRHVEESQLPRVDLNYIPFWAVTVKTPPDTPLTARAVSAVT